MPGCSQKEQAANGSCGTPTQILRCQHSSRQIDALAKFIGNFSCRLFTPSLSSIDATQHLKVCYLPPSSHVHFSCPTFQSLQTLHILQLWVTHAIKMYKQVVITTTNCSRNVTMACSNSADAHGYGRVQGSDLLPHSTYTLNTPPFPYLFDQIHLIVFLLKW